MGCYMSTPDSRVYTTEGKGRNFAFATASCQGWRREQEDAEDCLPDFDDNASLFILCDGHGGAEVAQYTVHHLPDFLKNHPLYKEGKYEEALEKAFVEFDVQLQSRRVMKSLAELAERNFDEVHKDKKFRIIKMETGEEIEQSPKEINSGNKDNNSEEASPVAGTSGAGGSGAGGSSSGAGGSTSGATSNGESTIADDVDPDTLRKEAQVPLKQLLEQYSDITSKRVKALRSNFQPSPVIRPKKEAGDEVVDPKVSSSTSSTSNENPNTSDDAQPQPTSSAPNGGEEAGPSSSSPSLKTLLIEQLMLGYFPKNAEDSDEDSDEDDSEFDGNSSNEDGDDEDDENAGEGSSKKHRLKHKRSSKGAELSEDSDDVDDDDDTDDYDDDEDDSDEEEDDEEDDDEEADNEDEEDHKDGGDDWDYLAADKFRQEQRQHQAGSDSGCTVVVALAKDGKLYVASAGDSRCIMIMRDGECKPMSFDHKPEDARERSRINKAGGKVTEGRVNGGLNLSRAFGDFIYKSPELDPKDQMITPYPDVKVADLDPKDVEYIFLACDGIWNSKRNQATANFIRKTAQTVNNDLVDICVRLFKDCMAPSTEGDGTGCDNMTCIIVRFENPATKKDSNESDLNTKKEEGDQDDSQSIDSTSCKRSSPSEETEQQQTSKRQCLDS